MNFKFIFYVMFNPTDESKQDRDWIQLNRISDLLQRVVDQMKLVWSQFFFIFVKQLGFFNSTILYN